MERDFCCPPRKQDIVRRTGREARWGSANDPALGSSHFETGSDGDGLFRPRSPGSGREHLHLRPVVRELSAAIEPDDVSSGYGGYCSITTQLARTVMAKLHLLCQQPKTRSKRFTSPPRLKRRLTLPPGTAARPRRRESVFG